MSTLYEWQDRNPVRLARKKRKLTRQDAAVVIGVSAASLSYWENGERTPAGDKWSILARFCELDGPEEFAEQWQHWLQKKPTLLPSS